MARLIVVSNRLPFTLSMSGSDFELTPSSGGLITALGSYLETRRANDETFECLWVGWPGGGVPQALESEVRAAAHRRGAYPVFLSEQETRDFYLGFCNSTLWPLFHYFPSYVDYNPRHWETYRHVNESFRDAVLEVLEPGDTIWIHDYQLLLLPALTGVS